MARTPVRWNRATKRWEDAAGNICRWSADHGYLTTYAAGVHNPTRWDRDNKRWEYQPAASHASLYKLDMSGNMVWSVDTGYGVSEMKEYGGYLYLLHKGEDGSHIEKRSTADGSLVDTITLTVSTYLRGARKIWPTADGLYATVDRDYYTAGKGVGERILHKFDYSGNVLWEDYGDRSAWLGWSGDDLLHATKDLLVVGDAVYASTYPHDCSPLYDEQTVANLWWCVARIVGSSGQRQWAAGLRASSSLYYSNLLSRHGSDIIKWGFHYLYSSMWPNIPHEVGLRSAGCWAMREGPDFQWVLTEFGGLWLGQETAAAGLAATTYTHNPGVYKVGDSGQERAVEYEYRPGNQMLAIVEAGGGYVVGGTISGGDEVAVVHYLDANLTRQHLWHDSRAGSGNCSSLAYDGSHVYAGCSRVEIT